MGNIQRNTRMDHQWIRIHNTIAYKQTINKLQLLINNTYNKKAVPLKTFQKLQRQINTCKHRHAKW